MIWQLRTCKQVHEYYNCITRHHYIHICIYTCYNNTLCADQAEVHSKCYTHRYIIMTQPNRIAFKVLWREFHRFMKWVPLWKAVEGAFTVIIHLCNCACIYVRIDNEILIMHNTKCMQCLPVPCRPYWLLHNLFVENLVFWPLSHSLWYSQHIPL